MSNATHFLKISAYIGNFYSKILDHESPKQENGSKEKKMPSFSIKYS
jgi:hypothetical protein